MEEKLTSPKIDRRAYTRARIIEALDDLDLAVNMWLAGRTRNAAGKAFSAVKALLSALVTKNLDKLAINNEWYAKKGYTAPSHSLKGVSIDLVKLGFADVEELVNVSLLLHDYQYNGFDPDFSKYEAKDEVLHDLVGLTMRTLRDVKAWFKENWDDKLELIYSVVLSDLEKVKGESTEGE
ncbi:hypothetical protein HS7_11620 [Sulfolobales archaeon HS-7]|nr:hypothetical protein HS7_11620 [Sulfolobales archaeon HS-7]